MQNTAMDPEQGSDSRLNATAHENILRHDPWTPEYGPWMLVQRRQNRPNVNRAIPNRVGPGPPNPTRILQC